MASLTKDQLWDACIKGNPAWEAEGASLSPAGLRKLFDLAFDRGYALGLETGRALVGPGPAPSLDALLEDVSPERRENLRRILGGAFGRGKGW